MLTEFHHIPFLGMTSNSELFILKEDQTQIEIELPSIPTLELIPDGYQSTASNEPELDDHHQEQDKPEAVSDKPSLGEFQVEEDDDGFRTPTSSDQKIPRATQCPRAPRKRRPEPIRKRKASPELRRRLELDLSKEVESMFPPGIQEDLGRKIKRARRGDTESD